MNKKTIIIIGAVAAVAVAVIAAGVTQWARLKSVASVAKSVTMNEEQVTAKSAENEQITQELQDEYQIPAIELTPEMQAAIASGAMTLEEAAAQFLAGTTAETDTTDAPESVTTPEPEAVTPVSEPETEPPASVKTPDPEPTPAPVKTPDPEPTPAPAKTPDPEPTPAPAKTPEPEPTPAPAKAPDPEPTPAPAKTPDPEPTPAPAKTPDPEPKAELSGETEAPQQSAEEKAKAEKEARVQNLFAQLYVLQSTFNTKVDNLINECIAEFLALAPENQTRAAKIRIVYNRMDTLTAMEDDCNAQVEGIASQLDEIDPALGEKARQYYKNEKELKKASLIATYGK